MKFLFLFLDGVGLGPDDPATNPLATAEMPNLGSLLGGRRLLANAAPLVSERATLLALDACLRVNGLPQSASGQATLVTGVNIPIAIGGHYGPKPNHAIRKILGSGNLFQTLQKSGCRIALLNAYPPPYFQAIESGRRMYSAIPMAVTSAGISLKTQVDMFAGQAMSADFTNQGWREQLGFPDLPLLSPCQAGKKLAELAQSLDFAFFEFWISDYIGHKQDMEAALSMLKSFDRVFGGLLDSWEDDSGLILLTSDHGNLENLATRRHTFNSVPSLVIGAPDLRKVFVKGLQDLTGVRPAIEQFF